MRIAVVGSPCSGKSTFSVTLGAELGLEVTHLDDLYWGARWARPDAATWASRVDVVLARDAWIVDGNYASSFAARFRRADLIVYVKRSRWRCLARYVERVARIAGGERALLPRAVRHSAARPWAPGDWRALPRKILSFEQQTEPEIFACAARVGAAVIVLDAVAALRRPVVGALDLEVTR